VFAQLAAPSRTRIERYKELNTAVEATAARINERFGDGGYRPIILLRSHHEPPTVYRFYRGSGRESDDSGSKTSVTGALNSIGASRSRVSSLVSAGAG
jgi:trehalose-6-phosphate synthase